MNPHDPEFDAEVQAEFEVDEYRHWVTFAPTEEWPMWVHRMRRGAPQGRSRFDLPGTDYGRREEEREMWYAQFERELRADQERVSADREARRREPVSRRQAYLNSLDDWDYFDETGRHRA